jgi:hypothetical protein
MANDAPPGGPTSPPSVPESPPGTPADSKRSARESDKQVNGLSATGGKSAHNGPPAYIGKALSDAEQLLGYAAESGIEVDAGTRDSILRARAAGSAGWDEKTVADLLEALTVLAAKLKPVTAESLRAFDAKPTFRAEITVSVCLAVIIVLFSVVSFVTTAISTAIKADIVTANELAAKLRAQLSPPSTQTKAAADSTAATARDPSQPPPGVNAIDVITELQQYASTIREIYTRAQQLNAFVARREWVPYASTHSNSRTNADSYNATFQLPQGLTNYWAATEERTGVYQRVRTFAQNVLDDVSFSYGAFAACVLPVLYALFGTCAYLLRLFEKQISTRTFIPSRAYAARFFVAAIGGTVVGLFNYTITQGASISPLAIAFLVGYAVDVFFAFLEGLLQAFTKKAVST